MVKTSCECKGFKCLVEGGRTEVNRRKQGSEGEELMPVQVVRSGNGPFTIEKCPIDGARAEKTG